MHMLTESELEHLKTQLFSTLTENSRNSIKLENDKTYALEQNQDRSLSIVKSSYCPIKN